MKVRTRFIRSVIKTAETCDTPMPWTRGTVRRAMIAGRKPAPAPLARRA